MESSLYGIYALFFVAEISLFGCVNSFDFWYVWYISTPKVAGVMSPALTTYKSTWQDKQLRATIGQVKRPKKHSSDLLKAKWIDRQRTWSTPTTMMAPYRMK